MRQRLRRADLVIGAVLVKGKAPRLVTRDMVTNIGRVV
jgi:alanine dehydrogenase